VPLGESKYDSLQVKANKRYSHGLNLTATFTWQNERTNMVNSSTVAAPNNTVTVWNVFDHPEDVFVVSDLSEPVITVVAFSYEVPAFSSNRFVRAALGGWTFGGMVRYASGMPIPVPASQNQINSLVFQTTTMNRVQGEPLFVKNLNGGDYDPNADFVLNPAAWANPGPGQFGTSPAYYDDFRMQRRPDEQLSVGRSFRIHNRARFEVRGEFFNAFNRIQLNNPDAGNPLQTQQRNAQGVPTAGFGRINTGSVFGPQRSGQIVTRLSW
jgi:hypothetical protein